MTFCAHEDHNRLRAAFVAVPVRAGLLDVIGVQHERRIARDAPENDWLCCVLSEVVGGLPALPLGKIKSRMEHPLKVVDYLDARVGQLLCSAQIKNSDMSLTEAVSLVTEVLLEGLPRSWPEALAERRYPFEELTDWRGLSLDEGDEDGLSAHRLEGDATSKRELSKRISQAVPHDARRFEIMSERLMLGTRRAHKTQGAGALRWELWTPFEIRRQKRWHATFAGLGCMHQRLTFCLPSRVREPADAVPVFELALTALEFADGSPLRDHYVTNLLVAVVNKTLDDLAFDLQDCGNCAELPVKVVVRLPSTLGGYQAIADRLGAVLKETRGPGVAWFTSVHISLAEPVLGPPVPEPRVRRRETLAPGDEYLFMESELDALQLCENGLFYPPWRFQRKKDHIEAYGMSPDRTVEAFDVEVASVPSRTDFHAYRAFIKRKAEACSDRFESINDAVECLESALSCAALPRVSVEQPTHVLRILVDVATSTQFAAVVPRGQPAIAFLQAATSSGPHALTIQPRCLVVSSSLWDREPSIHAWSTQHGVLTRRPASGGDGGAHHVKQWRSDMQHGIFETVRADRGVSLGQVRGWVDRHLAKLAGNLEYEAGHYTGAKSIESERYRQAEAAASTSRRS